MLSLADNTVSRLLSLDQMETAAFPGKRVDLIITRTFFEQVLPKLLFGNIYNNLLLRQRDHSKESNNWVVFTPVIQRASSEDGDRD